MVVKIIPFLPLIANTKINSTKSMYSLLHQPFKFMSHWLTLQPKKKHCHKIKLRLQCILTPTPFVFALIYLQKIPTSSLLHLKKTCQVRVIKPESVIFLSHTCLLKINDEIYGGSGETSYVLQTPASYLLLATYPFAR